MSQLKYGDTVTIIADSDQFSFLMGEVGTLKHFNGDKGYWSVALGDGRRYPLYEEEIVKLDEGEQK